MANEQLPQKLADLAAVIDDFLEKYEEIVSGQVAFNSIAELQADDTLTPDLDDGDLVRILAHGGFDLVKVAAGTVHYTSAGGADFRLRQDRASPMMLGATGDGVADDTAALDLLEASDCVDIDLGGRTYVYDGTYMTARPIRFGKIIDDGGTQSYEIDFDDIVVGAPSATYTGDLNDITETSVFRLGAGPLNAWSGVQLGDALLHVHVDASTARQLGLAAGAAWLRTKTGGTWGAWRQLAEADDLPEVVLSRQDITAEVGSVVFTEFDAAEFETYRFRFTSVAPVVDQARLIARTSSTGGTPVDSGAGDYAWGSTVFVGAGGTAAYGNTSDSAVVLHTTDAGNAVGNGAGEEGVCGELVLHRAGVAQKTVMTAEVLYHRASDGALARAHSHGERIEDAIVNAIEFRWHNGNFAASGSIEMIGIRGG